MRKMACGVDWHAVYVAQRVRAFMEEKGRIPTHDEMVEIDEGTGGDQCDDCCCGACGSRKARPCEECC